MKNSATCSDTPWTYTVRDRTVEEGSSLSVRREGRIFDNRGREIAVISSAMDQCIPDTALMGNASKMLAFLKMIRRSRLLPEEWDNLAATLVYEASGQKDVDEMYAEYEKEKK